MPDLSYSPSLFDLDATVAVVTHGACIPPAATGGPVGGPRFTLGVLRGTSPLPRGDSIALALDVVAVGISADGIFAHGAAVCGADVGR
jgi:hypothetical protein